MTLDDALPPATCAAIYIVNREPLDPAALPALRHGLARNRPPRFRHPPTTCNKMTAVQAGIRRHKPAFRAATDLDRSS